MSDAGEQIDMLLLVNRLRSSGDFDAIGGAAYLAEVGHSTPVAAHAAYYAGIVREKSTRRKLIHAANEAIGCAWNDAIDILDVIGGLQASLGAILVDRDDSDPIAATDAAVRALERVEAIAERGKSVGVQTGFYTLDSVCGGLFPGELCILAARPGIGKTSLAMQVATHAARFGLVYVATLEMSAVEIATRQICSIGHVNSRRVRTGSLRPDDMRAITAAANDFGSSMLLLHDRPSMTIAKIRRAIMRAKGIRMAVIDYLQLITPSDRKVKRYEQVGQMTAELKALAREADIPVLVLCQLNREAVGEDSKARKPGLHQLRESGSIEQDADVVWLLSRMLYKEGKETKTHGTASVLEVAKNRNGPVRDFRLEWHPEATSYSDPDEPQRYEEFA
jgi:replicative DNA helicase